MSCLFTWMTGKKIRVASYLNITDCSVHTCRADTYFIPLIHGAFDTNYKNDFASNRCCQGETLHLLSILASPERVLFVYRQLEIQWEIRFFAIPVPMGRNFSRATIHMIEYWFFDVSPRLDLSFMIIYGFCFQNEMFLIFCGRIFYHGIKPAPSLLFSCFFVFGWKQSRVFAQQFF